MLPRNSFLGHLPTASIKPFRGAKDTLRLMSELALGDRGERSAVVRRFTEWIVRDIAPKDYLGEILAVRHSLVQPSPTRPGTPMFRYVNDPRHVEFVKDPQRMVEEIMQDGTTAVDCDEQALMVACMAMQIGRRPQFVALGFSPGQLTHVATRVQEPKSNEWIWMDSVAGPREREAAEKSKEILIWDLD
jgi:hypothetical protein